MASQGGLPGWGRRPHSVPSPSPIGAPEQEALECRMAFPSSRSSRPGAAWAGSLGLGRGLEITLLRLTAFGLAATLLVGYGVSSLLAGRRDREALALTWWEVMRRPFPDVAAGRV